MNFPHTATVLRQTEVNEKSTYSSIGSVRCFLQPIDTESSERYGITFGKGSSLYIALDSDLEVGDRVTVGNSTYGVKGIRTHNYGNIGHKKASVEEQ